MSTAALQPERLTSRALDGAFAATELPALLLRPALYARSGSLEIRQAKMVSSLTFHGGQLVAAYGSRPAPARNGRTDRDQARAVIAAIVAGNAAIAWFLPGEDTGSLAAQADLGLFAAVWQATLAQYADTEPAQWAAEMARRSAVGVDAARVYLRQSHAKAALIEALDKPQACPSVRTLAALVMCGLLRVDSTSPVPAAVEGSTPTPAVPEPQPVQLTAVQGSAEPLQLTPVPPAPEPVRLTSVQRTAPPPVSSAMLAEPTQDIPTTFPPFAEEDMGLGEIRGRHRAWWIAATAGGGALAVGLVALMLAQHSNPVHDAAVQAAAAKPAVVHAPVTMAHAAAVQAVPEPSGSQPAPVAALPAPAPPKTNAAAGGDSEAQEQGPAADAPEPPIPDEAQFASARRARVKRADKRAGRPRTATATPPQKAAPASPAPRTLGTPPAAQVSSATPHVRSHTGRASGPGASASQGAGTPSPESASTAGATTAATYYGRAVQLLKQQQALPAVQALKRCVALQPNYALAYRLMGQAYAVLGRDRQAIDAFQKFVTLAPNHPDAPRLRRIIANYRAQ